MVNATDPRCRAGSGALVAAEWSRWTVRRSNRCRCLKRPGFG